MDAVILILVLIYGAMVIFWLAMPFIIYRMCKRLHTISTQTEWLVGEAMKKETIL